MARLSVAQVPESIRVGLLETFYSSLRDYPKEFRQLFDVHVGPTMGPGTGRHYAEVLQWASFGSFASKPDGDPIQYQRPEEGELVRITPYEFASGFRITKQAKEDMLYGIVEKQARELAYAAGYTMEVQAFRLLNNGFGTTGGTGHTAAGFDSLALFSTAHTLMRGGTTANRATTDTDLSVTALELAMDNLEGTVTESNTISPRRATKLVVPYQLRWIAKELIESELKPWTSDNEINPIKGELQYMPVHFLTDADSWFLMSDPGPMGHDLHVWIRQEPRTEMGDDFDTGDTKWKATFRMGSMHADFRGVYGSLGA